MNVWQSQDLMGWKSILKRPLVVVQGMVDGEYSMGILPNGLQNRIPHVEPLGTDS